MAREELNKILGTESVFEEKDAETENKKELIDRKLKKNELEARAKKARYEKYKARRISLYTQQYMDQGLELVKARKRAEERFAWTHHSYCDLHKSPLQIKTRANHIRG